MAFLAALPGLIAGSGITATQALGAVATGVSTLGTVAGGVAANRQAQQDAMNMEAAGREELAAAQRDAQMKRREGRLLSSRQQAVAAASGGGASDPTIVRLMTQTAADSELNAQSAMYGGYSRKAGLFAGARNRRAEGRASLLGGYLGGFGTAAAGFGRMKADDYYRQRNYG